MSAPDAPLSHLRPELALLLCCARTNLDAAGRARVEALLDEKIDWSYLIRTASDHAVLPLLYHNLQRIRPDAIPAPHLEQLQLHFSANAQSNLRLTAELLDVLRLLEARGLRAIPYKGAALAATAYGNLLLRQFGDLDLLVPPADVVAIKASLHERGYRARGRFADAPEDVHVRSHREYQLVLDDEIIVELHWRIAAHWQFPSDFPLDFDRLWERTQSVPIAGKTVRTLAPEDALLVLCVHGTSHEWCRLQLVCDVAELLGAHLRLDWGRIVERARASGGERMLGLGVQLAVVLLDLPLPDAARMRRMDAVIISLAEQVCGWLFRDTETGLGLLEEAAFHLRSRERVRDRLPYAVLYLREILLAGLTPTAADRQIVCLPSVLAPLYYLIRPLRLVGEQVRRFVR